MKTFRNLEDFQSEDLLDFINDKTIQMIRCFPAPSYFFSDKGNFITFKADYN